MNQEQQEGNNEYFHKNNQDRMEGYSGTSNMQMCNSCHEQFKNTFSEDHHYHILCPTCRNQFLEQSSTNALETEPMEVDQENLLRVPSFHQQPPLTSYQSFAESETFPSSEELPASGSLNQPNWSENHLPQIPSFDQPLLSAQSMEHMPSTESNERESGPRFVIMVFRRRPFNLAGNSSEAGQDSATMASGQNGEPSNTSEEENNGESTNQSTTSNGWNVDDRESRVLVLGRMRNALDLLFPLINLETDLLNMVLRLSELTARRQGTPPASKDAVQKIEEIEITEKHCHKNEADGSLEYPKCTVCLEEMHEKASLMPCGHLFNKECLMPWLEQHNQCPVCRYELPTDDPDYERQKQQQQMQSQQASTSTQ